MLWSMRAAPAAPDAFSRRILSAAATAASMAEARTSSTACASARAILSSASLVRRSSVSLSEARVSCARASASRRAWSTMASASCADVAVLLLVVGEQLLRLLAQAAGLVELLADRLGALVERLGDHAAAPCSRRGSPGTRRRRPRPRTPPLPASMGRSYSAARRTSAFATSSLVASLPISRATMAPATSPAMSPTLASARGLGVGDAPLGLGELGRDQRLHLGALLVDLGGELVARMPLAMALALARASASACS